MASPIPNGQIVKHTRSINVAVADEDIESVDHARCKVPFKPSRSEFGRVALRFTVASLLAGKVTMESLSRDFSEAPVVADGEL